MNCKSSWKAGRWMKGCTRRCVTLYRTSPSVEEEVKAEKKWPLLPTGIPMSAWICNRKKAQIMNRRKNLNEVSETTPPTLAQCESSPSLFDLKLSCAKTRQSRNSKVYYWPRTELIHFSNTSINLATMMRFIWFEIQTGRAPCRVSIIFAAEIFFGIYHAKI